MSARLIIDKAVITKIYHADKSGKDYLTIEDGESTYNISSGDLDLSKTPKLVPLRIEAVVSAFVFKQNQGLKALEFKATPVGA